MITSYWTSLLFVPAHSTKHLQSAIRRRPDAVILDLEDGVTQDDKPTARAGLRHAQQLLEKADIPCLLRVNSDAANMVRDFAAADRNTLTAIIVPKCIDVQLLELAQVQSESLIALIEGPGAIRNLHNIAQHKSVCALMFGPEDYAVEMGVSPQAKAIEHAAALVAMAATAAGKPSYGFVGSLANFSDLERFKLDIVLTRDLGFSGALAIHPTQLPIINTAFEPALIDIAWAKKVIDAQKVNPAGAFKLDERMIDAAVVRQAQRILHRAGEG